MSEWRDIETAPRDGRTVICFWPEVELDEVYGLVGEPIVGSARWIKPGPSFSEHWCLEGKWTPHDPTHWMPLPEPPKTSE